MKIAIFSDTFFPSTNGVVSVVHQSAQTLASLGHQVIIVTVSTHTNKELKKITQGKFEIIRLPSLPFWGYRGERFTLPLGVAWLKLKRFKPEIIHSHTPFAVGWEAVICAKALKIPLVGTHHTFFDHYLRHIKLDYVWAKKLFSWKYVIAYYNCCDLILSPSQSLAQQLSANGLKKPIEVIFNPTDTDFFQSPVESDKKRELKNRAGIKGKSIVYMGRVSYEKSIDQVIQAFALAQKQVPDLVLMILGDGPEKNNLKILAKELGLKDKIIFSGKYVHNQALIDLLCANDLFVTASKSENMPVSLLEAMACGLPVIAANANGNPEIVKDNLNGLLVAPDNPEQLALKIVGLIKNHEQIKNFSLAARKFTLQYSMINFTKTLENNYIKLINKL